MEFKKVENNTYVLIIENKEVGRCEFFDNDEDNIYLEIKKEYQGLGYGNLFFKEIIKNMNKDLFVKCSKDNHRMNKIISNNNGIEIYRKDGTIFYVIELKK